MKKLLGVVLLCLLSACGQGMNGTYGDRLGISRYVFQSNGEVTVQAMSVTQTMRYVRQDRSVTLQLPQGEAALEFTLREDGTLQGPMGIVLEKLDD